MQQSNAASANDSLGRFPEIVASNLENREFALPSDFEGEWNIVLIGFAQEQQRAMDTWLPALRVIAQRSSRVRVYELPVAPNSARAFRWLIDGGMRMGIPDRGTREATITLYTDKRAFRSALKIPDESRIYVMLVRRDGRVCWRTSGPFDRSSFVAMEKTIASDSTR